MLIIYSSVFFVLLKQADAIRCLNCENYEVTYGSSFGGNPFSGKSDPSCETRTTATTTCSYGEKCGRVKGTVNVDLLIFGKITAKVTIRRCMADPGLGLGCHKHADLQGLLNGVLQFLVALGTVTIDGELCLFNGPYTCSDSLSIPGYGCFHWGIVAAVIVGAVILLASFIACCYCCCCKPSRPHRGAVIQHAPAQPGIVMIHSASGVSPAVQSAPSVYPASVAPVAPPTYNAGPSVAVNPTYGNVPIGFKSETKGPQKY